MNAEEWLCHLRDATSLPPSTDDPDTLIAAWEVVVVARQELLDHAPNLRSVVVDVVQQLGLEIESRQQAWRDAFAFARDRIGTQRVGVAKVRRYQRSTNAADF
jgi:hypothetical protein